MEIMTELLFVYPHTKIRNILKMLQHKKSHVAVVVDDFGGTLGIVTMEDIPEKLVGEIWDEHDEVEEEGCPSLQSGNATCVWPANNKVNA